MKERFNFKAVNKKEGIVIRFSLSDKYIPSFDENWEIYQCTGLRDKNGTLIFEGNIVKFKTKFNGILIGNVYWSNNLQFNVKFYMENKNILYADRDLIFWADKEEKLEIIGNIYENAELLNGEHCIKYKRGV